MNNHQRGPLHEPAADYFVNRQPVLDLYWQWANNIPHNHGHQSHALTGLRRTGKTAILHKLFNRLFHEQKAVIPIYISFAEYLKKDQPIDVYEFVREYFSGVVRSYLAFCYGLPELLRQMSKYEYLYLVAKEKADELVLEWYRQFELIAASKFEAAHGMTQFVINFPKGYAWTKEMPMVIIIDEFQVLTEVYNPDKDRLYDVTNSFQHASEDPWAPLLVSGSSISMLKEKALSGMLSGRFSVWPLQPLGEAFSVDLITLMAESTQTPMTDELALEIYKVTQGYPYSIERIMYTMAQEKHDLPKVEALDEIVYFELTNRLGVLRNHYDDEYAKYIRQLNGDQTIRKILYWITNQDQTQVEINPNIVAKTLDLEVLEVRDSLDKLHRLDIIERHAGNIFWGPSDPLLAKYLNYTHHLEVENLPATDAQAHLRRELRRQQGEFNRKVGHMTEVIVAGVIRNFDSRQVAGGDYFNTDGVVKLPHMQNILRRAGVIKDGHLYEIDVIGEHRNYGRLEGDAEMAAWLVSVRYQKGKMTRPDVEEFIRQAAEVQAEKQYGAVTRWYFSKAGFTKPAIKLLDEEGIYYSDLGEFNGLSGLFGLLPLSM